LRFFFQWGAYGMLLSVQRPGYGFRGRQVQEFYPLSKTSVAALEPILPIVLWLPEFFSGGKSAGA